VELVAALVPSGRGLRLEALAQLTTPLPPLVLAPSAESLLQQLHGPATSLALLQNPAQLLADLGPDDDGAANPWRQLLAPVLSQALARETGPLPALVAAADAGPLLWSAQSEGWLLGSRADAPDPEALQPALQAAGFTAAPLQSKGQTLQAWTRLQSKPVRGNPDQLQAQLAGARALEGGLAWWGQGLAVLNQQHEGHQPPRERLEQLQALASPQAPVQWAMDGPTARALLGRWQPWRLLTSLSGTPLSGPVQGAALSLEADAPQALRLRAQLQLG
jgi:hypothetical protein